MGYPGAPMGYPMGMPPPGYPYGVPMARPPYMGAPSPYPMGVPSGMPPVMPGMPPVHVAPPPVGAPYVPPAGALPIRIGAPISAPPRLIGVETTVYVGRIPASATDDFIERLLQQCGKVANWKRMMDPISNTPRPFGFARFENEEGALRALRLLSNLEIDGNQLLLNVDDRTREALDRYQKSKAAIANIKEQQRQQRQQQQQEQQEQQQKEQQQKEQQEQQQQQSADGDASAPASDKPADEPAAAVAEKPSEEPAAEKEEEDVPDEVIAAKIKALLSDKKAGDFLKGMETGSAEDGDNPEATKREEERQASSNWDKELERERREREKDRAREREKRRGEREREARKRERDEREYREMEKDWETREREKERLRERREREEKKEREWQIEKELNYDEEEDRKRRKAGKRRKEREREEQDDEEDRRREVEEERARIEEERRRQEEELRRRQEEEAEAYRSSVASEAEEQRAGVKRTYDASLADDTENGLTPISPDSSDQRVKMGLRIAAPTLLKKPTKLGVTPGFNPDEEQNPLTNPKRKKLVPLEPMRTEEQIKKEREEEAKQIVAMIPASKADLFNFQLSWDIVDEAEIVQKRMKPWVTKKIVEYLGEEEATLIEFVLAKMSNHMAPQEILDQLAFVLEDEAEVFVIKLWRMLIFEMIRAQKAKERGVNIAV